MSLWYINYLWWLFCGIYPYFGTFYIICVIDFQYMHQIYNICVHHWLLPATKMVQTLLSASVHGPKSSGHTKSRTVCGIFSSMKIYLPRTMLICLQTWRNFSYKKPRSRWTVSKSHLTFTTFKILNGSAITCLLQSILASMKRS